MLSKLALAGLTAAVLVNAQSEATPNPAIPAMPTTVAGIPTIEGALVYDGPPVQGFTGPGGNATIQSGLPMATYVATLPPIQFDNATGTTISGTVTASTNTNGTGVMFSFNLAGFPNESAYGPFVYHIHELPLNAAGNCTSSMAHLDPTQRGELHSCEMAAPQTCQAGDLAGKHGNITTPTFTVMFSDLYLSTDPSSAYFFGDKSFVIHSRNATRLTCANFTLSTSSSPTPSGTSSPSPSATIAVAGAGTVSAVMSLVLGAVGVVGVLLL